MDFETTQVFLSYSRQDKTIAFKIRRVLEQKGYLVWQDTHSIAGGAVWVESITQGIHTSNVFICLVSGESSKSEWVQIELLEAKEKNKFIIPVLIDDTPIPMVLRNLQPVDLKSNMDLGIKEIIKALENLPSSNKPLVTVEEKRKPANIIFIFLISIIGLVLIFLISLPNLTPLPESSLAHTKSSIEPIGANPTDALPTLIPTEIDVITTITETSSPTATDTLTPSPQPTLVSPRPTIRIEAYEGNGSPGNISLLYPPEDSQFEVNQPMFIRFNARNSSGISKIELKINDEVIHTLYWYGTLATTPQIIFDYVPRETGPKQAEIIIYRDNTVIASTEMRFFAVRDDLGTPTPSFSESLPQINLSDRTCRVMPNIDVRVVDGPGVQYQGVGVISDGSLARVISKSRDDFWVNVETSNMSGWISSLYVSEYGNCEDIPIFAP